MENDDKQSSASKDSRPQKDAGLFTPTVWRGSALAMGLAIGVALSLAMNNWVWLAVGLVLAIAMWSAPVQPKPGRTTPPDAAPDKAETSEPEAEPDDNR